METQEIKELVWVGSSLEDLKEFPDEVKHEVGFALHRADDQDIEIIVRPKRQNDAKLRLAYHPG
ncbi:MAG: hypothetical protein LC660_18700 [Desulfobacteraceae bacterium]|nr:hypothetical protein [Desulfobacteraceae bacterium]